MEPTFIVNATWPTIGNRGGNGKDILRMYAHVIMYRTTNSEPVQIWLLAQSHKVWRPDKSTVIVRGRNVPGRRMQIEFLSILDLGKPQMFARTESF